MMIRWVGLCGMRPNLTLEPVDGADAEPYFPYHFANPDALGEFAPRKRYLSGSAPGRPSFLRTFPALLTNLPSRASFSFMTLGPALTRWRIIERSNSAKPCGGATQ